MGRILQAMAYFARVLLGLCLVLAVHASTEEVANLGGDAGEVDLGEDARPMGELSSSTSYAGTPADTTLEYVLNTGATQGLKELEGQELMGEDADVDAGASEINLTHLQSHLERHADMMGKVERMKALKVIMGMPPARAVAEESEVVMLQMRATTGWGRRRRNSAWHKKKKKKAVKTVVKKVVVKAPAPPSKMSRIDESKIKARKAIAMAREKEHKARKKADAEAKAAQAEADKKKQLELAQKRRHELVKKQEKRREKKMKIDTEKAAKRAKEAAAKAENLQKAIKRAKEASKKEHIVEKQMKKALEVKGKKEREVSIKAAQEKQEKIKRELVYKKKAEVEAKFANEQVIKKAKEVRLKQAHEVKKKKAEEKGRKKAAELARKTSTETRQKAAREKALKKRHEKLMKQTEIVNKKKAEERKEKEVQENALKLKREKALKAAAKRRIDEEKRAKAEKRTAMETKHKQLAKQAAEAANKEATERKTKRKQEAEEKKTREKTMKRAHELMKKKAMEIVRKVHRESAEKITQEQQQKKFAENKHKEKRAKAKEVVDKLLKSLKNSSEKLAKSRVVAKAKRQVYRTVHPKEQKMKAEATNLSKIAKELAHKIKGVGTRKKPKASCDLSSNLERLKKKGILTSRGKKCRISCTLKPSPLGIKAVCLLADKREQGIVKCKKDLFVRSQTVLSAVMSEFDSFKQCAGKPVKANKKPSAELGEQALPSLVKGGIEIGEYVYALKGLRDANGNVNAGEAIDLLMRCNRDGKGKSEELGQSAQYNVRNTGKFNDKGAPPKCHSKALSSSVAAIAATKQKGCSIKCTAGSMGYAKYTAECHGSGVKSCFLSASEQYHRQVMASYFSWKVQCAQYH